jgi:hypothetical protein
MHAESLATRFEFQGKAGTLEALAPLLTAGRVLPLQRFTAARWRREPELVLASLSKLFGDQPLIVRSSTRAEDQAACSCAGVYESIADVQGQRALAEAIDRVVDSYGSTANDTDEVLIQPMATGVRSCGVAMTRDPETGLPYHVIDYTIGQGTDGVTAGSEAVQSFVALKSAQRAEPAALQGLFALLSELERLTGCDSLDVEFALTTDGPVLFQVRPMTATSSTRSARMGDAELHATLAMEAARIASIAEAVRPGCVEVPALFGLMPDWNPAEMIGVKPRPLAFSLYKDLITDLNWASARFRYGYRDMRDKQLMFQFCGSPYVCIPHSVESFVPAALPQNVVAATVSACCRHLGAHQHLHDKIEFAIIPTCFTPSLAMVAADSVGAFAELTAPQRALYLSELRHVTEHIVSSDGPFFSDLSLVPRIEQRVLAFAMASESEDPLQQFRRALSSAKVVGEVFAGAARAAFVATAILKSLEELGRVRCGFADAFIGGANTIGRRISDDFRLLSKESFLARHGHVRPGTYDIRVARYDEAPDSYFDWNTPLHRSAAGDDPRPVERSAIAAVQQTFDECDLQLAASHFLDFAAAAVGARERVKYLYGAFVSDALKALSRWGELHGLSRDDLSFTTLSELACSAEEAAARVQGSLAENRRRWSATHDVRAPVIVCRHEDLVAHEVQTCHPNFITRGSAEGETAVLCAQSGAPPNLEGRIVLIESADPGFDWIFTRRIAGFVTAYGGENSHMSIRAREFLIPAAIGVGEARFRTLALASRLRLDCTERRIQVLA